MQADCICVNPICNVSNALLRTYLCCWIRAKSKGSELQMSAHTTHRVRALRDTQFHEDVSMISIIRQIRMVEKEETYFVCEL